VHVEFFPFGAGRGVALLFTHHYHNMDTPKLKLYINLVFGLAAEVRRIKFWAKGVG